LDNSNLRQASALLHSARLDLSFPTLEHAPLLMDGINASLGDLRHISWAKDAFDLARAQQACRRDAEMVAAGECLIYLAVERATGAFVGSVDLHSFDFDAPRCQIGYVGDSRRAGRGLMREAAWAVMQHGFELGLQRVEAWCEVGNHRSAHFARCLGMQHEGILRSVERDRDGHLCDQVLLARLRTDPPPLRAG